MREMVEVILYEDGTYEINDIESRFMTEKLYGYNGKMKMHYQKYICEKDKWQYYLMRLLSTKDIDNEIRELKKKKKAMEKLKEKIVKEIKENK